MKYSDLTLREKDITLYQSLLLERYHSVNMTIISVVLDWVLLNNSSETFWYGSEMETVCQREST